jgi:hypothetical protein
MVTAAPAIALFLRKSRREEAITVFLGESTAGNRARVVSHANLGYGKQPRFAIQ